MAYKVSGTVSDDSKIYVINTSDDSIEQVKAVSAGAYFVNLLDEEDVHVMAVRTSDNKALAYGDVQAEYEFNDYSETFVVAASRDDGVSYGSNWFYEETSAFAFGSSTSRLGVARFTNVSIPQGAQIEAANYKLVYAENNSTTQSINIRAVDEDNSPQRWEDSPWGEPSNWEALGMTSSISDTLPNNQSVGTVWTSNSIISIIQHIVDRPGWSQNNALYVVMKATVNTGTTQNMANWDHSTYDPPKLYVEWRA